MDLEFLKRLKKIIPGQKEVDSSIFKDPIAGKTEWTYMGKMESKGRAYNIRQLSVFRLRFQATEKIHIFFISAILISLSIILTPVIISILKETFTLGKNDLLWLGFGFVFAAILGLGYIYTYKPIVFDKQLGYFWKGRHLPKQIEPPEKSKKYARLDQIYAIQLLAKYDVDRSSSSNSYELNLILNDADRFFIGNYDNPNQLHEDARKLSVFLGMPIWDATYVK